MCNISICIATFNGEKYIKEQLSSILSQLSLHDEVIISDDSSTDNTVKIIYEFNDPRVKLIEGQKFKNPIFNFENAIKKAKGDILFLADQDDIWSENKVEICLQYLKKYDVVVSDCKVMDSDGSILAESLFKLKSSRKGLVKNLFRNSYQGCCMAFRKSLLKVALPFPKEIPLHDIWLGFIAELFFKVKFIDSQLVLYRKHNLNFSSTTETSQFTFINKILFRWNIIKYVFLASYRFIRSV